jgi:hypothetical protein
MPVRHLIHEATGRGGGLLLGSVHGDRIELSGGCGLGCRIEQLAQYLSLKAAITDSG